MYYSYVIHISLFIRVLRFVMRNFMYYILREVFIIKSYSFRTGKEDSDIEELLESMSLSSRTQLIKDAIRFYAGVGIELRRLNTQIEKLLSGNLSGVFSSKLTKQESKKDDNIDILESSIEDLLNL